MNSKLSPFSYSKKIFVFKDEEYNLPYINLCLKNLKRYLPSGFELIILDEKNVYDFVDFEFRNDKILDSKNKICGAFKDNYYNYVKALVLYHNGGLFLDADTIVTEKFDIPFELLGVANLVAYLDGVENVCSGYLLANKHSPILEELIRRYQIDFYLQQNCFFVEKNKNFILNDVINNFNKSDVVLLDAEKNGYLIEKTLFGISSAHLYRDFYFSNKYSVDDFFSNTCGISALKNSETPEKYRIMSENDFLKQDILLARLFV